MATLFPAKSATVAAAEVAAALVDLAESEPLAATVEMGGPEAHDMPELVRRVAEARGVKARVLPVNVPGSAGQAMRDGTLIPKNPWRTGTQTFDEWLALGTQK